MKKKDLNPPILTNQFQELMGKKVVIMIRREPRKYVGVLTREDPYFVYLKDAELINGKNKMKTPTATISKHIIGEVVEVPVEEA